MPRLIISIPEITVFVSSPRDVAAERQIVKRAIQEINADPAWRNRCVLKPLAYEDGEVPSQMGKPAQRVVNDFMRMSYEADIVVCIFSNRMGTPTIDEKSGREYLSGTHYEFDSAYQAYSNGGQVAPRIMLFLGFRDFPGDSSDEDHEQYIAARNFKKQIKSRTEYDGLYFEYRDLDKLESLVRIHLKRHLDQILAASTPLEVKPAKDDPAPCARAYVSQLAESYRWLELQGIREAGALRIELEKVYVALKAEPESDYDRQQAANLHAVEILDAAGVDSLNVIQQTSLEQYDADIIRRTFRPAREETRRATATATSVRTLGDAFRQHRRIVILGGPGSGKTTLGRWLALQLARTMTRQMDMERPQRIEVPVSQVDPDDSRLEGELLDLGPARLPIFLRLSHFARELAERERQQQPSLALIDYFGFDPDCRSLADGLTTEARNALFREHLQNRTAVCILDGLDELPEANRRDVVLKIQDFIEQHTQSDSATAASCMPWEGGGNQVVVTSRYIGYKFAPVRAGCAHFGIQSMQRPAVERFARAWTDAVNAELATEGQPHVVAERLIAEIYNEARVKVRELATNPLLVTILATVYWRDGRLPDQRAGVYDRVVENLLQIWLRRQECRANQLTREELLAALQPLAADMQQNACSNGLISLERIGELVEGPLANLRNLKPDDPRFGKIREALLKTIRTHVGLLAEQSNGNYAFFHRTFQEFLAARHLLAHRPTAAEELGDRIEDPLWREPLLLALGFAMIDGAWGPEARRRLLTEFLATDGPDALIPRAAMLLATALPDLRNASSAVVSETTVRLLTSYAISQDQGLAGTVLREQIEEAFDRLRCSGHANPVARQLTESLRRPAGGRDLAGAVATILRRIDWFTTELVESLLLAVSRDVAKLNWPINWALLSALGHRPTTLSWRTPDTVLNIERLLSTYLPMRKLLETSPELVALVRDDIDWRCLLVALYGGIGHFQLLERLKQRKKTDTPSAAVTLPVPIPILEEEPGIDLLIPSVDFSPQDIVHDLADSGLSRQIQHHLVARRAACDLTDSFRQRWNTGGPVGAEALIGLAALGEDIIPLLQVAQAQSVRQPAVQSVIARFSWLRVLLQEPLSRTMEDAARTLPEGIPEQHQLDLLKVALAARVANGGTTLPVSDTIPERRYVAGSTPAVRDALEAEYWSFVFSGTSPENEVPPFSMVVNQMTQPLDRLIHSWSLLPSAMNHQAANRLPWPQPILAPRADSPVDQYLAMLDAMMSVPKVHRSTAGYVLGRCRPFLDAHPDLAWETLAVCWYHGREFSRQYRLAARGSPISDLPADCQMPDELDNYIAWLPADSEVFRRISRIADPYLRFRALWRLLETPLEVDFLGMVEQIREPHDQVRAFEWILMTIPPAAVGLLDHVGLLEPMLHASSRIADPENRARALSRLAFFAGEQLDVLLCQTVEAVREIAEEHRKTETIREIRAIWGRTLGVAGALDAVAKTISDPWLRNKALGRASLLVRAYRHRFADQFLAWRLPPEAAPTASVFRLPDPTRHIPWELVYLDATAVEVESLDATPTGVGADWDRLHGTERSTAIAGLVVAAQEAGLSVTTREASVLDRVVQSGHVADLEALWPNLNCPDPRAMGTVVRWTTRLDRAGQWSALVQAEAGRLTPEVVTSVIELLAGATDRLKMRAALALHGPTPHTRNPARRWSVRRIGAETVDVLARCVAQSSHTPAVQTAMNWARSDIHHDDREALEGWLAQAESGGPAAPAAWLLRSLQSVQGDLIPTLLMALRSGSPQLQRTLLFGLASLAHCSEDFRLSASDIHAAIRAVSHDVRNGVKLLPEGTKTLLDVVRQTVESGVLGDRVAHARRLLEANLIWLDGSCLTDAQQCIAKLKTIGGQLYIELGNPETGTGSYWAKTEKAAAPLAENSSVLELLLSWLASVSIAGDEDGYSHHLLTATEAVARLSPDTFAAHAKPEFWEPVLTEWAQYGQHWSARLAAVRLIGKLRCVTERVAGALRSAMNDVSFVQKAAYACVSEFRRVEGDILPELLQLLDDPSAGVVAATAQLLVSIARAEVTSADRRRILQSIQRAAIKSSAVRSVYLMDESSGTMSIRYVDRLDRILYGAIFEISGL